MFSQHSEKPHKFRLLDHFQCDKIYDLRHIALSQDRIDYLMTFFQFHPFTTHIIVNQDVLKLQNHKEFFTFCFQHDIHIVLTYRQSDKIIHTLDMRHVNFTRAMTQNLLEFTRNNPKISRLNLSHCLMNSACAEILAEMNTVSHLNLSHNPIGAKGAVAIAGNRHFRFLKLNVAGVGHQGIEQLAECKSLERLDLSRNFASDASARKFMVNTTLKRVDLSSNLISASTAQSLFDRNPSYILEGNELTPCDFEFLYGRQIIAAFALAKNCDLNHMTMNGVLFNTILTCLSIIAEFCGVSKKVNVKPQNFLQSGFFGETVRNRVEWKQGEHKRKAKDVLEGLAKKRSPGRA